LEAGYDNKGVQIILVVALFLALFTIDIRDCMLSSNGTDDQICMLLFAVLIMFAVEIPVCWVCKTGYRWSFFFWMDLLGTFSLIFDICFLFPMADSNTTVLRASRASRIGSRAARLTKLIRLLKVVRVVRVVKLFKFFKVFKSKKTKEEDTSASKISEQLSEMIAKRVAGLVMILVMVLPLCQYEGIDASFQAFLSRFDDSIAYNEVSVAVNDSL
jgi:hypothetical protein